MLFSVGDLKFHQCEACKHLVRQVRQYITHLGSDPVILLFSQIFSVVFVQVAVV